MWVFTTVGLLSTVSGNIAHTELTPSSSVVISEWLVLMYMCSMCVYCCSERTYVVYGNIMYDKRVIRGSTYAQTVIPSVCYSLLTFNLFTCLCLLGGPET